MAETAAQRNDAKVLRIITMLYDEGVTVTNIVRLLNHQFDTHTFIAIDELWPSIQRANHGHYNTPNVTIWSQNDQSPKSPRRSHR